LLHQTFQYPIRHIRPHTLATTTTTSRNKAAFRFEVKTKRAGVFSFYLATIERKIAGKQKRGGGEEKTGKLGKEKTSWTTSNHLYLWLLTRQSD